MKPTLYVALVAFGFATSFGCAPHLRPRPTVPAEYRRATVDANDPTRDPPDTRYRLAYESFWWNCVAVMADDEEARCPALCSGTPAAADGCREGAADAERMVRELIGRWGVPKTKTRLRSLVGTPAVQLSIRRYFSSGHERDRESRTVAGATLECRSSDIVR